MVTKYIAADKFKTNTINLFFEDNLSRERAAGNALIPMILRRGCKKYPMLLDISRRLEELYGATFGFETFKKGERQYTHLSLEFLSDKYVGTGGKLFDETANLIESIIYEPLLIGTKAFRHDYTSQEIENLRKIIKGRINDKRQYALDRCVEEMCKGEGYSVSETGSEEDLDGIGPEQAYLRYADMTMQMPLIIYITGDVDEEKRNNFFEKIIRRRQQPERELSPLSGNPVKPSKVREVTEKLDVNQGKLCMGFRTGVPGNDSKKYAATLIFNSIFGEGSSMHSKLFVNVREKNSLAYYISSRIERFKGIMLVSSGIESSKKDIVVQLVMEQLEAVRKGDISDYEMNASKDKILSSLETINDSLMSMVAYDLNQVITGDNTEISSLREIIRNTTAEDVQKIASEIELDTVYFLSPK